jgi:diacylglycerol kinase (ATP)
VKAFVVVNPTKVDDIDALRTNVAKRCADRGWDDPVVLETTAEDPGAGMARDAVARGADVILSAGGDGTVMSIAAALSGTGVPLGIVPVGTGNLLARNLGLPLDVGTAIDVALDGDQRTIDLGRCTTDSDGVPTVFAVMAGVGFDAAMMGDAPENVKAKGGWAAYVISGAKHLRDRSIAVGLRVDEGPRLTRQVSAVIVGNVGTLQGGLALMPDATPDDGLLDVVVLQPTRPIDWLRVIGRLVARRKKQDGQLERFRGRRIEIRLREPQPSQLDGDPQGDVRSMVLEALPGALVVRVPPAA